ncbi:MAG: hypothetical protein QXO15_01615 [Nitrososphaerota archaeon]
MILFRKSKVEESRQKKVDKAQRRLEDFKSSQNEKQAPAWILAIKKIESEVNEKIRVFNSNIKNIKAFSLRLEELVKMLNSGEISQNIYDLLLEELSNDLSLLIEETFLIRESLEVLKARAKIEWIRERIGMGYSEQEVERVPWVRSEEVYSPIYKWKEIVDKIDGALSSLTFEEEISLIERYLSTIKKWGMPASKLKNFEEVKKILQQRLTILTEKWSSIRKDKIGKIMDLEMKASQIKDEIKEVEVRYAIGEIDRSRCDLMLSKLQGSLRRIEKDLYDIRSYVDDIDLKIFRIMELLREPL